VEGSAADRFARWALLPVRAVLAPLFASTLAEWARAIGPALAIMLLHFVWVVRSDAAFEDAAVEASAERARRMSARLSGVRMPSGRGRQPALSWLRLPPLGEPAVAVFWKNVLAVARGDRFFKQAVIFAGGALVLSVVAFFRPSLVDFATMVLGVWGAMLVLLGPLWLRNDLRGDLRRLEVLRTYPIEPPRLIAAEIASSALVLSAIEAALLVALFVTNLRNPEVAMPVLERVGVLLAAVLALPAVNGLATSIHNAAALLFPAWLPATGSERRAGIEAMGQVYLVLIVMVLLLALLLVAPTVVGGVAYLVLAPQYGAGWSLVPAVLAGSAAAAGELLLAVRWLGRVFARIEPSAVAATG
jgi:ABC-2 type transport system permease protein